MKVFISAKGVQNVRNRLPVLVENRRKTAAFCSSSVPSLEFLCQFRKRVSRRAIHDQPL